MDFIHREPGNGFESQNTTMLQTPSLSEATSLSVEVLIRLEVKPPALKKSTLVGKYGKDLPPIPPSEDLRKLRTEMESLRQENAILRGQLNLWAHQVRRYRQIAGAAQEIAKDTLVGVKHIHDAIFVMKRTDRTVKKEWMVYQNEDGENPSGFLAENQI